MDDGNCRDESSSSTVAAATSWCNTNSTCSSWPNNIWHTSNSTYQDHHLLGVTADSSHRSSDDFIAKHTSHNHNLLSWTQVLSQDVTDVDLHNNMGETEENFVNSISSSKTSILDPVCDYLKMLDNHNWDHTNSTPSFHSTFQTQSLKNYDNNYKNDTRMIKCSRVTKYDNWSIAPPLEPVQDCHNKTISSFNPISHLYYNNTRVPTQVIGNTKMSSVLTQSNRQETESADVYDKYYNEFMIPQCISTVPDILDAPKTRVAANFAMKINGRGQGISNQAKKKKCEQTHSDGVSKRSKPHEGSTLVVSPPKVPKVKLGDRISALQQIVSPFGKTDTASVLMEAIGYINFLQEQVQLLTNPYMKSCNSHKEAWDGMTRQVVNMLGDLKSKGLCLVPISSTPQACHDNTGAEYWSPTYRGCLYR